MKGGPQSWRKRPRSVSATGQRIRHAKCAWLTWPSVEAAPIRKQANNGSRDTFGWDNAKLVLKLTTSLGRIVLPRRCSMEGAQNLSVVGTQDLLVSASRRACGCRIGSPQAPRSVSFRQPPCGRSQSVFWLQIFPGVRAHTVSRMKKKGDATAQQRRIPALTPK